MSDLPDLLEGTRQELESRTLAQIAASLASSNVNELLVGDSADQVGPVEKYVDLATLFLDRARMYIEKDLGWKTSTKVEGDVT